MTIENTRAGQNAVEKVFAMQQGSGEDSYARNSQPQQFLMENIIAPELLAALDNMTLTHTGKPIVVADLGCSTGLNTINNMNLILNRLKERFVTSAEVASDSSSTVLPDFQVFFNDLPSNDFNYLFQLLNEHRDSLAYFAAGVPGSFYGRLFPRSSVHVFFSSLCLHWMSKIPDAVLDKNSPAFNKGDMWMIRGRTEVGAAFKEQADLDLKQFLSARAEEMVPGGLLFMFFNGRGDSDPARQWPNESYSYEVWKCMNESWDSMVSQGHMTEEHRDAYNVPLYFRSLQEVHEAITSCGSDFRIEKVMRRETGGSKVSDLFPNVPASELRKRTTLFMKSMHSPLVEAHIGKELATIYWENFELRMLENKIDELILTMEKDPHYKQNSDINMVILIRS
ncbi:hypothetical protein Mapa_008544 [Marchantia paleacea]|nr:hypothetical protein Mapa_008544 [Marchantia paleacea]